MEHSGQAIEALLDEQRLFDPPAAFHAAARIRDEQIYADADRDPAAWWKARALEELEWIDAPTQGLDDSNPPFYKWFADGILNVSVNCLDRHLAAGGGDKTAYIWVGEPAEDERTISYRELHDEVNRFANVLKGLGVQRGDRVAIYLGMVPELPVAMLACARIGAAHSVVFGGFSSHVARRTHRRRRVQGADHRRRRLAQGLRSCRSRTTPTQRSRRARAARSSTSSSLRRTGHDVGWVEGRDQLVARAHGGRRRLVRARAPRRGGDAVPPLHLRDDRAPEGHPAHERRLPARREADAQDGLRRPPGRRLLVRRRHRLGDRAQLHRVRAAREPHDGRHVRGSARAPRLGSPLGDHRAARRDDLLHGADGDPRVREGRRRAPRGPRSLDAAPARHGRRADQPRGVDLVPRARRRRSLPDRRHVVADRDGRDHDLAAAGRHEHEAGLGLPAAPRDPGRDRRRAGQRGAARRGRLPHADAPVAVDAAHVLRRRRALREDLLGALRPARLLHRRRGEARHRRLLLAARPRRRRDQRLGPPHLDDRDRERARRAPRGRRGRGDRSEGRPDRRVDRELRDPARRRAAGTTPCARSCATTWPSVIGKIARPKLLLFTDDLPKTRSGKIMRRLLKDIAEGREIGDTTTLRDPEIVQSIKDQADQQLGRAPRV